jgi:sugar phosphate isomerase/epimerase
MMVTGGMATPVALQLYTLRNDAAQNVAAVLERVASVGYVGVEIAGLHGMGSEGFRRRLDETGLQLVAAHVALPAGPAGDGVLDEQEALGNNVLVTGFGPDDFSSHDAIERTAERMNEAAEHVRTRGITLGYHNHWWEFADGPDGWMPMDAFLELVDPDIFLEVDVYWLQAAGVDVVATLTELGSRVRLLHAKDGPCTLPGRQADGRTLDPQTAVGEGRVDIAAAVGAARSALWHIVELDECSGDTFEAVEASYQFLTQSGLSKDRSARRSARTRSS